MKYFIYFKVNKDQVNKEHQEQVNKIMNLLSGSSANSDYF